ncbi:Hypothetical protein UVM_LOCUS303 [uncultured virus]|nr:Hypothetical protein UVM_LOCUS303 [uncultured virus]
MSASDESSSESEEESEPQFRAVYHAGGARKRPRSEQTEVATRFVRARPSEAPVGAATAPAPVGRLHTLADRQRLWRALRDGDAILEACSIGDLVRHPLDVRRSTGSSNSILLFGPLNYSAGRQRDDESDAQYADRRRRVAAIGRRDVVVKLSFESRHPELDNSLDIERAVYRDVVADAADRRYTPNLILFVGDYPCGRFTTGTRALAGADLVGAAVDRLRTEMYEPDEEYDFGRASLLILERGRGMPMAEWMNTPDAKKLDRWPPILFQILYTIQVLTELGVRHNDLHVRITTVLFDRLPDTARAHTQLNNIWIEQDLTPSNLVYFTTPEVYFVVPMRNALVKIFDFDHAWYAAAGDNTLLNQDNWCRVRGVCNGPNAKMDSFTVLSRIYNNPHTPKPVREWILRWFRDDDTLLLRNWPQAGRPCLVVEEDANGHVTCDGNWEPLDDQLAPVAEILDRGFRQFRRELPDYDPAYLPQNGFEEVFRLPALTGQVTLSAQDIQPIRFPVVATS